MFSAYTKLSFLSLALVLPIALFFLPNIIYAISPNSIAVDVTPENYLPNENVDITLSSFSANLDTVLITWFVNGRNTFSGVGKKSFSINSGTSGSNTNVLVKMSFPDGEIQKTISIRPNVMAVLWQANDSYVPPFYKGKAMPTIESEIKVVAMPEIKVAGKIVDSKNLNYSWRKDYGNEQEASGYGKNSFNYTGDYLDPSNYIEVNASTADGQYLSSANINITAGSPELSFYKIDSTMGTIWEKTVEDGYIIKNGEIIIAIPYFISPKQIETPILTWNWFINDTLVNIEETAKNMIPLKVEEGSYGTSKLRLRIDSSSKIFQTVDKEVELQF
jgi:hypothetical protein